MNRFRLTGDWYISKDGDDANSGLTPDLPKSSINVVNKVDTIIGAGVYKGAHTINNNSGVFAFNTTLQPDGIVVLNMTGDFNTIADTNRILAINPVGTYPLYMNFNGFRWYLGIDSNSRIDFNYLVIKDCSNFFRTSFSMVNSIMTNCVFDNFSGDLTTTPTISINIRGCSFFNSSFTILSNADFKDIYVDEATTISVSTIWSAGKFANNNFRGLISVGGTLYELKRERDGTVINPNLAVADFVDIYPTCYTDGNFSQDPLFLNIDKRDYWSVDAGSPNLLGTESGIGNIGNVDFANVTKATDTEFTTGAIVDLTTLGGDFVLDGASTIGTVTSTAIQIAPIPQVIKTLNFAALLNFDSDELIDTGENDNVTTVDNFADGTAGANPRRLSYEMRWSNQSTIPTLDAHWDNQNYITAGAYAKFEYNTKPLIGVNGLGNGDIDFILASSVGIKAKWIEVRVTMRNGLG